MHDTKTNQGNNVELLGKLVDTEKIESPALRKMVNTMQDPDYVTKLYNKHSDWREKGQCGCVVGCVAW